MAHCWLINDYSYISFRRSKIKFTLKTGLTLTHCYQKPLLKVRYGEVCYGVNYGHV